MKQKLKLNDVKEAHGVYEWAGYSYNIGKGCVHNCRYCYARGMNKPEPGVLPRRWDDELDLVYKTEIHQAADDIIMFPTMHDITPGYLRTYMKTLRNLLEAGNQVVMVTKPHSLCIENLCNEFSDYKEWLLFRMTITSLDDELSRFWEPGAPLPGDRVKALQYAYEQGYQTSVSVEPMIDTVEGTVTLYHSLTPYITEDIWFGKMNVINKRVDIRDKETKEAVSTIRQNQSDENILLLYEQLKDLPKVKWKDSIRGVVDRNK